MISCLAATSMPRVGSSRISRRGLGREPAREHRLLLVAARELARSACRCRRRWMPSAATKRSAISPAGARATGRATRRAAPAAPGRCSRAPTARRRCRRACAPPGTCARPWRIACAGLVEAHRLAVDAQLAAVAAVEAEQQPRQLGAARAEQAADADDLAAAQASGRPDAAGRAGRGRAPRSSGARRAVGAGAAARRRRRARSARARPSRVISAAGGSSAVRYSPTRSPLRSTVMRSEIAYIWSRKWVTNRIAMPSPRSRRSTANRRSTSSLVEARGRLVEDQHLAPTTLERARDRHHLLHRHRVAREQPRHVDVEIQPGEQRARVARACAASRCATARPRRVADSGRRRCSPPPTGWGRGSPPGRRC